jgi:MraZ protein
MPYHRHLPLIKEKVELMFLGQYEHSIDDKGRLTIPARYRDLLADGAVITQGFDPNLIILSPASFQNLIERVSETSITDPVARDLRRLLFGHADQVEIDRVGRMLIPSFLRGEAGLKTNVTILGMGKYFELWSTEIWQDHSKSSFNTEANSQRFTAFELSVR